MARAFIYFAGLALVARAAQIENPGPSGPAADTAVWPAFEIWRAACNRLPSNRALAGGAPLKRLLPLRTFSELDAVLTVFFQQCASGDMSIKTNWVGTAPETNTFFNFRAGYFDASVARPSAPSIPFQPFAQMLSLPKGSEVLFHADLHGDVRSLLAMLQWLNENGYLRDFTIARPNFYIVFLGDYTDRGAYGLEVLYTLFRLKVANPNHVLLARGNHEDVSLQSRYGFLDEGYAKYGREFNARRVLRAYDLLPVAVYVGTGTNFLQCHHGGMEPGFDPRPLLSSASAVSFQMLGPLKQQAFLKSNPAFLEQLDPASRRDAVAQFRDFRPESPTTPVTLGFMWNDFTVLSDEPQFAINPGRAFVYGEQATRCLLRSDSTSARQIRAVFRAHQQSSILNPMMRRLLASRGVFRHWQAADRAALRNASVSQLREILEHGDVRAMPDGSVWTFNVSPDSVYGEGCGYDFDAFGLLSLTEDFGQWRLRVVNVSIAPQTPAH